MKIMAILIAVVALVSSANALDNAGNSTAATMAVADPSRPGSDTTRDADRKPAQTLVFAGIKSGDKVADYVAAAGYFTRLFASLVGSKGHVYAVEPTAFFNRARRWQPATDASFDQVCKVASGFETW
jgi:predicted methyltransferase